MYFPGYMSRVAALQLSLRESVCGGDEGGRGGGGGGGGDGGGGGGGGGGDGGADGGNGKIGGSGQSGDGGGGEEDGRMSPTRPFSDVCSDALLLVSLDCAGKVCVC